MKLAFVLKPGSLATPYVSRSYGEIGTSKTVAFVVPPQTGGSGPQQLEWSSGAPDAKLPLFATNKATGQPQQLTLSGYRPTGCRRYQMNSAVLCGNGLEESMLGLALLEGDNAAVPAGVYVGTLRVEARGWHDKTFVEDLIFEYEITIERGTSEPVFGTPEAQ